MICKKCGCSYEADLPSCPKCGCPNDSVDSTSNEKDNSTVCPYCGAPIEGFKICQWCGTPLVEGVEHEKHERVISDSFIPADESIEHEKQESVQPDTNNTAPSSSIDKNKKKPFNPWYILLPAGALLIAFFCGIIVKNRTVDDYEGYDEIAEIDSNDWGGTPPQSATQPMVSTNQNSTDNVEPNNENQAWMYGIWTVIDDYSDFQFIKNDEGELEGIGFLEVSTISIVPGEYIYINKSNPEEVIEWSKQKHLGTNPSYVQWYASEVDGHEKGMASCEEGEPFVIRSVSGIQPIDAECGLYADFENKRILFIYVPFEDEITIYGHKVKDYVF